MTAATLDVEARIAADPAAVGFHAGGVPLPALTLIAVEEPENNLAPFYLSRRANRDFLVGAKRPSPASP
jgi:putative ATP-dependent endonuclease of OLD family